jgi:hypothetical protein
MRKLEVKAMAGLGTKIPVDIMRRLKLKSAKEGRTMQELVTEALQTYLKVRQQGKRTTA